MLRGGSSRDMVLFQPGYMKDSKTIINIRQERENLRVISILDILSIMVTLNLKVLDPMMLVILRIARLYAVPCCYYHLRVSPKLMVSSRCQPVGPL